MARKLVCDKCGQELTEKDEIDLALEGQEVWAVTARARGAEPRGIIPCKNFIRCSGEMKLVNDSKVGHFRQRLSNLFHQ